MNTARWTCRAAAQTILVFAATCAAAAEWQLAWEFDTGQQLPMAAVADQQQRPYLYVALKSGGLGVLDISTATPREVANVGLDQLQQMDVTNLWQSGDTLLLSLGGHFAGPGSEHAGLAIVSVSQPQRPKVLSVWQSGEKLQGAAVVVSDGGFAYLGAMSAGVMIFDVTDPSRVRLLSTMQPDVNFPRPNPGRVQHPNSRGLAIRGDLLFVANDAGGLRVLDVKDRAQPVEIGRYINEAMMRKQQAYNNIVLDGDRAYIAVDYAGLEIVDISNPRQIRQVGWWNPWQADTLKNLWFNSPGHANQLAFDAKRKLVYLSAGDSEMQAVDVSKPHSPRLAEHFGEPKNKLGVWGLGTSEDYIFLTYIKAIVPFQGTWAGVKAVSRR